jgi:FkbM family methyltransferase
MHALDFIYSYEGPVSFLIQFDANSDHQAEIDRPEASFRGSDSAVPNLYALIKSRFVQLVILRKYYKNWAGLVATCLFGTIRKEAILRNGLVLGFSDQITNHAVLANLFGLGLLLEKDWSITKAEEECINMHSDELKLTIKCRLNNGADIYHLAEIFVQRHYGSSFANKIIIDVGMSNGDSSIFFARMGAFRVIGVEPGSESFSLAMENIKINKLEDVITPLNVALASWSGQGELMISQLEPNGGRVLPRIASPSKTDTITEVKTLTFQDVLKEFGFSYVDLLKMDCEGCEFDILSNLDNTSLNQIGEIVAELHGPEEKLAKKLSTSGFKITLDLGSTFHARRVI